MLSVCPSVRIVWNIKIGIKVGFGENNMYVFFVGIYLEFLNHENCDVVASSFDAGISRVCMVRYT